MIDINLVREDYERVRSNYAKRKDKKVLSDLKELKKVDAEWRELIQEIQSLRHERNEISNRLKKELNKKLIEKSKELKKKINELEALKEEKEARRRDLLLRLPNLVHDSVPYGESDADNKVVRRVFNKPRFSFKPLHHVELTEGVLSDTVRAGKTSGSRFFFLKKELVILDLALQRMAVDMLVKKGFTPVIPPFMIRRGVYEGVTDLRDFEEMLYKVEGEDLYLIATSEHPLMGYRMNEIIPREELPIKLCGVSPCFRKEAGSHGKDTKGVFRTHQFNKVEQVVLCEPKDSWRVHEELLSNAESFLKKLRIHYQVVNVCTGDLGIVAAKKYDIEAWFPGQGKYREVVSCSNCTDYQARRLKIRYKDEKGVVRYVHSLNSTMVATNRVMLALLENYQTKKGVIRVPGALQKYTGFKKIVLKE